MSRNSDKNLALNVTNVKNISDAWIEHITFSNDGNYMAVCSSIETTLIKIKDAMILDVHNMLQHNDIVWKSVFSQTGEILFTCCANGTIYAWDTNSCDMIYKLEIDERSISVFGLSVSPDNETMAVCTLGGKISIVSLVDRMIRSSFEAHEGSVEDVCYSPSGQLLASCAKDGTIKLWRNVESAEDRSSKECIGHIHWVYSCSFSADEKYTISASADKTIKLWSVESCECLQTFHGHQNIVWNSQFVDDDGTTLVSCSSDGTLRLWGVESGKLLEKLWNPGNFDYSGGSPKDQLFWCTVNKNGTHIVTGSYYGNIYTVSISNEVLRNKNKIKLRIAKQEIEQQRQTVAKSIVASAVANARIATERLELPDSLSPTGSLTS